ncbi:Uncharacterized protein APZ42_009811, partial [Daphnia magna]
KVPKKKRIEVHTYQTALNCSKCEVTCHYPCNPNLWMDFCPVFWRSEEFFPTMSDIALPLTIAFISNHSKILNTTAAVAAAVTAGVVSTATSVLVRNISTGRACKVCPGKCATTDHANELTKWMYVQEEETRTLHDIRKKYDDAMAKTLSFEELKNALQGEAEQLKFEIIKAMDEITPCANLLKKIALRGDPLSTPEY